MSRTYYIHEANVTLADGAVDQSLNVFFFPQIASRGQMSITVSREPGTDEDMHAYANKKLVEAARTLKGFTLIDQKLTSVGGEDSVELAYQWTPPNREPVHQSIAVVKLKSVFLAFTFSVLPSDRDGCLTTWRTFLNSVIFREE